MTDSVPSTLLYGQALVLLREMNAAVTSGTLQDQNDFSLRLREILTRYEQNAGMPLLAYEMFAETEPPLSQKMNRVWSMTGHDISLMQNQVDVLRAATVDIYNAAIADIELARNENQQVANQLKTLQLYSNSVDPTIIIFSDAFGSSDYIDTSSVPAEQRASITNGVLTLGPQGALVDLSPSSQVTILDTSNGVPGNNQEIDLAATATSAIAKAAASTDPYYVFYAEETRAGDLRALNDGQPDTWFEYEIYQVSKLDHASAANLGFKYSRTNSDASVVDFDWSSGPKGGTLLLDLQFDLQSSVSINSIIYTPYGLRDNTNFPVLITLVEISDDGAQWTALNPQNVWVTSNPNLESARIAPNISRSAVWSFEQQTARYVRFHLKQPNSVAAPVGHLWYTKKDTGSSTTTNNNPAENLVGRKTTTVRVDGPEPSYDDPSLVLAAGSSATASLIQHRELFHGQRWAMGIRDISIQQIQYQTLSTMVTVPLRVGGIVDRISLSADIYVPPSWDTTQAWVQFFVSPDNGVNWFQISRIQDDFLGVPEIIAFNDPIPSQFREAGVAYYDVSGTVDTLRLKINLLSPDSSNNTSTPIVRSYQLKVKRR